MLKYKWLKIFLVFLTGLYVVYFALYPLTIKRDVSSLRFLRKVNGSLFPRHFGLSRWSFYTKGNGIVQSEIYYKNTDGTYEQVTNKIAPRIKKGWGPLSSITIVRFNMGIVHVYSKKPEKYEWLCDQYEIAKNNRVYAITAQIEDSFKPLKITDLPEINIDGSGMVQKRYNIKGRDILLYSFICGTK